MAQMRSRREQVDAHRFITSRMNQALVLANPDSVERPLRRIGVSIFASVMIMVLIFAGFAIAALLNKGNDAPQLNHIILEKGTTSIYVYTFAHDESEENGDEPKLWPVTNFTSALLLLEPYNGEPPVQELKPESLAGYPRGFMVGLNDVPPSPPPPDSLLQDEDWNACSLHREDGGVRSHMFTQLLVADLPEPEFLGDEEWMLAESVVREGESRMYLLWDDRRHEITDPDSALAALDMTASDAVPVTDDVLTTLDDGPPLEAEPEDYFGEPSEVVDADGNQLDYGQTVESNGSKYVLLRVEEEPELARIGDTTEMLLEGQLGDTVPIAADEVSRVGIEAEYEKPNFPQARKETRTLDSDRPAVCSVFDPGAEDDTGLRIAYYSNAPSDMTEPAESVELNDDGTIKSNLENLTTQVVMPPGTAAVVVAKGPTGLDIAGFSYLIDSLGFSYGLVDKGTTGSTRQLLGYGEVDPVGVPNSMLTLIPSATDLDPEQAQYETAPDAEGPPVFDSGEDEQEAGDDEQEG
ncbi:type VII secretion protein EccB [Glycomyces xiaoerkulensis]|uniref:type VII secretion protein EccB n=1 Tax=Glycomyces xiaoerkulensis TaxID=2038139 RepID=UPI000C257901|nr:type VII secretion protein EccB [Glycomyces xiaoerkulensis]